MKIKKLNNTLNSLIQKANVFTYLKEKKHKLAKTNTILNTLATHILN